VPSAHFHPGVKIIVCRTATAEIIRKIIQPKGAVVVMKIPETLQWKRIFLFGLLISAGLSALLCVNPTEGASRHRGSVELLARLIRAEAGAEPYTGQVAVGAVILNRIQSSKFPKTIAGVVYQPKAFESVSNGQINRGATGSTRKAARAAIQGWDPSGGALFFFNPGKVRRGSYVWTRRIIQKIGKHVFAL
jgi:N-acetylmuramoyl-L-alanine amidase